MIKMIKNTLMYSVIASGYYLIKAQKAVQAATDHMEQVEEALYHPNFEALDKVLSAQEALCRYAGNLLVKTSESIYPQASKEDKAQFTPQNFLRKHAQGKPALLPLFQDYDTLVEGAQTLRNFNMPILKALEDGYPNTAFKKAISYVEEGSLHKLASPLVASQYVLPVLQTLFLNKRRVVGLNENEEELWAQIGAYSAQHITNPTKDMAIFDILGLIQDNAPEDEINTAVSKLLATHMDPSSNYGFLDVRLENYLMPALIDNYDSAALDKLNKEILHIFNIVYPSYTEVVKQEKSFIDWIDDMGEKLWDNDTVGTEALLTDMRKTLEAHPAMESTDRLFSVMEKEEIVDWYDKFLLPVANALGSQDIEAAHQVLVAHLKSPESFLKAKATSLTVKEDLYTYAQAVFELYPGKTTRQEDKWYNELQDYIGDTKDDMAHMLLLDLIRAPDIHSLEFEEIALEYLNEFDIPSESETFTDDYPMPEQLKLYLRPEAIDKIEGFVSQLKGSMPSATPATLPRPSASMGR